MIIVNNKNIVNFKYKLKKKTAAEKRKLLTHCHNFACW